MDSMDWKMRLPPALLCLALLSACSPPPEPRHLLLVTIDTLRADHLGLYGYARDTSPVMDAFARRGVVFENAWVQWPKTTPSMVSMFSATYPHENGIVVEARPQWVPEEMVMLPEVLRDLGFRTTGVTANGVLGRESNFHQGFETFREMWMEGGGRERREAKRVTDVALEELESLAAHSARSIPTEEGERWFLWVHYIDPHQYTPPPGYAELFLEDDLFQSKRVAVNPDRTTYKGISSKLFEKTGNVDDVGVQIANYDGEIRYLDEHLARLFKGLEDLGLEDETLVVLTADHGESLGEHDYYFHHGHVPYEGDVRVPLVFRFPGDRYRGKRISTPVELRSLAPTLLDALGEAPESQPFRAASLMPAIRSGDISGLPETIYTESGGYPTYIHATYTVAARKGSMKLVLPRSDWARERHNGRDLELYDLDADPTEERDLAPQQRQVANAMRAKIHQWLIEVPAIPAGMGRGANLDYRRETRENLRALGYLE